MPKYRIKTPDGQSYEVTAPDGASQEEVLAYAQQHHSEQPAAKPQGAMDWAKRQAGLAARYLTSGPLEFAGIFTDPLAIAAGLPTARQGAQALGDRAGLPNPQGPYERVAGDVSKAMTGGLPMLGGARAMAGAPGLVGRVATVAADQPGLQMLSAGTGAAAAGTARENGASPLAQLGFGLLGGIVPGAAFAAPAMARGAFRGGEVGRKTVESNIDTFGRANTSPSAGQASESRVSRGLESLLSTVPGGAGPMARKADQQAAQIGQKVDGVANALAPRASAEQAGRGIEKGVDTFVDSFRQTSSKLYAEAEQLVPPTMKLAPSATEAYLAGAAKTAPGAKHLSGLLSNPKLAAIKDAMDQDLATGGGSLTFETMKVLRSKVGEMIGDAGIMSDIPTKQLRKLYGALSEDMQGAIRATGNPRAIQAFNRANSHYKAMFGDNGRADVLARIVERNGGPEKVFAAAMSGTREGATTLRAVTQSLPSDGRKQLAAAVIKRLGKATNGRQDETGEVFSTETFLTNWNAMAPEAKSALFARLGPRFNADMDAIAKTAANLRAGSKVFANPSQSGGKVAQISAATSFLAALATGHPAGAAGIAAGVGSANVMGRVMTNPKFVSWLAQQTKLPAGAFAQQVAALRSTGEATKDQDLIDAADALAKNRNNQ